MLVLASGLFALLARKLLKRLVQARLWLAKMLAARLLRARLLRARMMLARLLQARMLAAMLLEMLRAMLLEVLLAMLLARPQARLLRTPVQKPAATSVPDQSHALSCTARGSGGSWIWKATEVQHCVQPHSGSQSPAPGSRGSQASSPVSLLESQPLSTGSLNPPPRRLLPASLPRSRKTLQKC